MPKQLVIVESPTKARTLKKFLGADYIVNSSVGHIRDLPASAAEIPAAYKKEAWARLGVNVENDFAPLYVMHGDKKKRVAELKKQLADVDVLLLATDEDREGEAISWHLVDVLRPKIPTRRMVFHEITREAIVWKQFDRPYSASSGRQHCCGRPSFRSWRTAPRPRFTAFPRNGRRPSHAACRIPLPSVHDGASVAVSDLFGLRDPRGRLRPERWRQWPGMTRRGDPRRSAWKRLLFESGCAVFKREVGDWIEPQPTA